MTALLLTLPILILQVIKVTSVGAFSGQLADQRALGHDCGTVPLPSVLSFSYSSSEAYFTPSYMTRMCNEFAKVRLTDPPSDPLSV